MTIQELDTYLEGKRTADGLPYPLVPDAEPIVIRLRSGMTPQEIAAISPLTSNSSIGKESWSKWAAFALTPFGWSCWPTPHFRCNRLFLLTLYGGSGEETVGRFATLVDFVEREFGEPGEGMKQGWFRTKPAKPGSQPNLFRWVKSWGKVTVLLEPRDGEPMLWIEWKSSDKS